MTTEPQILTDEQIAQTLNDAGVTEYADVPLRYDLEFARAIEQAVLQSPEVQAWKRDAERYQAIRNLLYATDIPIGEAMLSMRVTGRCPDLEEFDASIDAANEDQP